MTQIANNIVKFFSEKWPILAIAVVAIVFCFLLYKWLFTPRKSTVQSNSEKNRKRIDKGISYKENQKALQAKIDIAKFWGKLPLVSFTEEDKEELQKLILAVDKRTPSGRLMLPEEIYCQQLFIALAIIFVCVILMFLTPFTILGVLIVPIIMRTPVKTLEGERHSACCNNERRYSAQRTFKYCFQIITSISAPAIFRQAVIQLLFFCFCLVIKRSRNITSKLYTKSQTLSTVSFQHGTKAL